MTLFISVISLSVEVLSDLSEPEEEFVWLFSCFDQILGHPYLKIIEKIPVMSKQSLFISIISFWTVLPTLLEKSA